MSSCWCDKWSMQDHLGIGGTNICALHCEGRCWLGYWDAVLGLHGVEFKFFCLLYFFYIFSLPVFPGEVGRKTEQETALEFTFCPEDEWNALKAPFYSCIFLVQGSREGLLEENRHLGVCVICMQMPLCFCRGGYSFQDKTTESEGLWSLKIMCDKWYMYFFNSFQGL